MIAILLFIGQTQKVFSSPESLSASDLIAKMHSAVRAACPISGTLVDVQDGRKDPTVIRFKASYPHLLSLVATGHIPFEMHWTPGTFCTYYPPPVAECVKESEPDPVQPPEIYMIGFESAYSDNNAYESFQGATTAVFAGKPVYEIHVETPGMGSPAQTTLYIDRKTFLPLGYDEVTERFGSSRDTYKNIIVHAKLTAKDFAWTPPRGTLVSKPR